MKREISYRRLQLPAAATAESLPSASVGPAGHRLVQPLLEQNRAREGKMV